MLACVVVAGGKATRMGPWAPRTKPFLGVGPWDNEKKEGIGPCIVFRALRHFATIPHTLEPKYFVSVSKDMHAEQIKDSFPPLPQEVRVLYDKTPSPLLGPLQALETYFPRAVLLHNGDDLIHHASLMQMIWQIKQEPQAPTLLAVEREQRGQFGLLTPANTVDEKPVLARGWIGAGLVYLPDFAIEYALHNNIPNVSVLINRLYDEQGTMTRIVRSKHPWATINTPEEYLAACGDPTWRLNS